MVRNIRLSSSLGEMSAESKAYISKLPKDEQEGLSDQDKAAVAAIGGASAMFMGPAGPALTTWFATGGAAWVQNAIMSALPSSLHAQGAYSWVDSVIEPVLKQVVKAKNTLQRGAQDSYHLLLQQKDLVAPDERIPEQFLWKTIGKEVAEIDSLAAWGGSPDRFEYYVYELALKHGYGDGYTRVVGRPAGRTISANFLSRDACQKARGDVIRSGNHFCVKVTGLTERPAPGEPEAVAQELAKAWADVRLVPYREGLREALENLGTVLDRYKKKVSVPRIRIKAEPTSPSPTPRFAARRPTYSDQDKMRIALLFAFAAASGAYLLYQKNR